MSETVNRISARFLMVVAFFGIFLYGLLAALPGSVLPTLERGQYLPSDSDVGTFLLINAIGAVVAYIVSGPVMDRLGRKIALALGSVLVLLSMVGFALVVTRVKPEAALLPIFLCSLVLGMGANAIVAAGHALVADVAESWRNAALNLLDICFGLGLAALPLVVQRIQQQGGVQMVFWTLAGLTVLLLVAASFPRYPTVGHESGSAAGDVRSLLSNGSFWLLAIALFMYVGAEVAVGKWVVTFMQRDGQILANSGLNAESLRIIAQGSPEEQTRFFEQSREGVAVATYALRTLSFFAFALLFGRLVSSLLLGVLRVNSSWLIAAASIFTSVALIIAFTASTPATVRAGLILAGFGMGPIFPTSVGLASMIAPRIAGTAMSWVMGVGFAGLLLIPPAVGYVSDALGEGTGNLRAGLFVVVAAAITMAVLHVLLALRERRRLAAGEAALAREEARAADGA